MITLYSLRRKMGPEDFLNKLQADYHLTIKEFFNEVHFFYFTFAIKAGARGKSQDKSIYIIDQNLFVPAFTEFEIQYNNDLPYVIIL